MIRGLCEQITLSVQPTNDHEKKDRWNQQRLSGIK